MRNGRRTGSVIDDDIRSSLDLLDGVIGEFDDGLTSSAESEANQSLARHERNRARRGRSDMEEQVRPELRSSHLSINDQIDNIFSQLTQEIYNDEKVNKETKVRLSRSPTRNRFDPLPPPPTSSTQTHPPPIDRKKKPAEKKSSYKSTGHSRLQDTKTLTNDKPRPTRHKYVKSSDRQNFSLPHEKMKNGKGNGEVILYEDHEFSNTMEKVVAEVHKNADYAKQVPPPMPEKQRIHLKNSSIDRYKETSKSFLQRQQKNLSSQEAAVIQELREKVTDKQGKISKFDNRRGRPQQKRPGKRSETQSQPRHSSPQRNNLYESMGAPGAPAERRMKPNREDYRRSRSMGPLDSREPRQRSRSRGGRDKVMSPPSPAEAEETIAKLLPRYPNGLPPERQRSMIDLRVMEEVRKNQRRSMAVGPYEDLPPHLRNHLMPSAFRNPNSYRTQIPAYLDEQLRFQHQMNIEAQREHLLTRGFPVSHPLVSGEIPLHPELRGQLHFEIPSRTTLPLGPEDYRRFMPEMSRKGMQSAFPGSQATDFSADQKRVARQLSRKENSFVGLSDRKKKEKHDNSRNKSEENKAKPFSWLNSGFGGKHKEEMNSRATHHDQQWFMREREDMKSMPPVHIAEDFDAKSKVLNRDDKSRSSFGMILKDKFQKNPNMYFPDTPGPRTSSKSSEFVETKSGRSSSVKQPDSLSDTDTLIHNMSEGSFDKESAGHSIGSNKSSRSSGKSSSHSHDSMNGTPRMIRRSESITTPKQPVNTSFIIPTNPSVILNKKTIRNYVPPESNNMLRNFEDNRKTNKAQHMQAVHSAKEKMKNRENKSERKSSVEKLIDDFHRNLPSPPPSKSADLSIPFSDGDSLFSGLTMESPVKDKSSHKVGTVTSQTSHWSVASSAASFDYHSVNSMENKKKMSNDGPTARKKMSDHGGHSSHLPSLNELEVGERIPPDGAAAESPATTGRKINEDNKSNNKNNSSKKPVNKSKEVIGDLIKAPDVDDDLHLLRKLISEGRISGLNEKPPPFIPPTPPSKASHKRKVEGQAGAAAPAAPTAPTAPAPPAAPAPKSADRPRKSRDAPKPPTQIPTQTQIKPPPATSNSDVKFISGRRINSVESINEDPSSGPGVRRGGKNIKRSTSMHVPKDKVRDDDADDAALAQLIADSTEKRFKISNILKVKWKKKHYSFDLG